MDNNFNQQQAPVQPTYQQAPAQPMYQQAPAQPMYQQAPAQPMYQQAPTQPTYQQPTYQQPAYQQVPKKPSNINMKELIALICSGTGTFMAILGSILTCSCSASKTYDLDALKNVFTKLSGDIHSLSLVCLVAILGAIVAATGVVFGILALKDKNATVKAGKMSYVAIAVGIFGVMYGILPVLTICGYNCSLNSNMSSSLFK